MFRPVIAAQGYQGWTFLQSTYDRAYLEKQLKAPITVENFLSDRRLLRITMTAFGLQGEEWKRGFVGKVLTEAADPSSTFLARLNNPSYTALARALAPANGKIALNPAAIADIAKRFETETFEIAIGEADESMRLSLNYASSIGDLVRRGSGEETTLYRMLGDVPVRTVLEQALNLSSSMRRLPIERQAAMLKDALASKMDVSPVSRLADPAVTEKMLRRFHAMAQLNPSSPVSSASALGGAASLNLFLSRL